MIPTTVFFVAALLNVVLAVLLWFMPRLTRPDLFFAVTVEPAFPSTPEARRIVRAYRSGIVVVALVVLAALVAAFTRARALAPATVYLQLAASFVVFIRARGRVLPHAVAPTTIREAPLAASGAIVPGGWAAATGPFAILAAAGVYVQIHMDTIPERSIVPLVTASATIVLLTFVLYGLTHWVRAVNAGGPSGERERRFRRLVAAILIAIEYVVALQSSVAALAPLHPSARPGGAAAIAIGFLPLAIVVVGTVLLARLGQGGSAGVRGARAGTPVGDRIPDRYWRLGVFYFNRDDPAIFVERRFGLGYTMNFAHPVSWLIVIVPLLVAIAVPLIATHAHTGRLAP